jgi:lipoprotein-releasing system ATP-binding protein
MALAEKTDRILRIVDGKIVCELKKKGDAFVTSESCELGEDDGKVRRA